MDLKEAHIIGPDPLSHWYYKSKAEAMATLIGDEPPSVILDVGAGSGFFSAYLLETSPAREAWCVDTGYAEDRDERRADGRGKEPRQRAMRHAEHTRSLPSRFAR